MSVDNEFDDMVADMEVDTVAEIVAKMVVNMVANMAICMGHMAWRTKKRRSQAGPKGPKTAQNGPPAIPRLLLQHIYQ